MIKFFLKKGSLVNASNHKAETPISIAYKNKYTEIVELLLEAGACDLIEEAYRKMIMKANKEEEK
jgi:ankyrin repeat protein